MIADESVPASAPRSTHWLDLAAIVVCTLAWGTTWFAITLQLGVVDPVVSVAYRFTLATVLLFGWCMVRGEAISLTHAQHGAALGIGLFTFAIDYALVYWAEERVTSAVVAVVFAAMAFFNLVAFRIAFGQRASLLVWAAAGLGVLGVALLSWEEIVSAHMGTRALIGVGLTVAAVAGAAIGNVFARRGELAGASVAGSTAWAMLYGTVFLAAFALVTGRSWTFEPTWPYVISLLHLSLNGSVIAFLLYYGLARRRGYTVASYISALTPPVAMAVSSLFEAKSWGILAFGGVALVLLGQWLFLRLRRS